MKAKQLPLTARPAIEPFPTTLRDPVYRGVAFGTKDRPADIANAFVDTYIKRRKHAPRELHCHPSMVEVIGQEVMGVPVLGVGKALRVFLLVPQEV